MTADPKNNYRHLLKDSVRMEVDFYNTDQSRGIAAPPFEKPHRPEAIKIDLGSPTASWDSLPEMDVKTAIARRKSRRRYLESSLSLDELSFLLWAKVIAIDAGHVCQNLYLACETISAGTCDVAAYDQKRADRLLCVDGDEEFVIYMAPMGKKS